MARTIEFISKKEGVLFCLHIQNNGNSKRYVVICYWHGRKRPEELKEKKWFGYKQFSDIGSAIAWIKRHY